MSRETINMRKEGEIIGRNLPKKPVWRNLQTVVGLVNKLKKEGQNQPFHYCVGQEQNKKQDHKKTKQRQNKVYTTKIN